MILERRLSRLQRAVIQRSPGLVFLYPSAQASVHAGRQGCAEVVRDLKPLACLPRPNPGSHAAIIFCSSCCAQQLSPLPPRPLYHTLGYANRSTREVIISLLARHNSSFATTPPALAAAAKTRISQGTSQTSSSKHRPSCHLPRDDDCQIAQHV